uniref:Uncharacterized protein n=1 Tax=Solanum lycopersicum TaxID=4081 RepID=A0A3Q7H7W2_SOLLC
MTSPPPFFFPYNQCRCLNLAFLFVLAPNRVEISTISILIPSKERLNFKRKLNLIKKTYFTIHWSSSVVVESVLKLVVSLRSQLSLIINLLIVHLQSTFELQVPKLPLMMLVVPPQAELEGNLMKTEQG